MRLLKKYIHSDMEKLTDPKLFERTAARAIVLKGEEILLIYTKRYNDYSIPGGGVDEGEDIKAGLRRELSEETGAEQIKIIEAFGIYEEYRPTYKEGYDFMHMMSYFYVCDCHKTLGEASPEAYEQANGSVPVWININKAIVYNNKVIKNNENSMGLSIGRETFVLELILKEIVEGKKTD